MNINLVKKAISSYVYDLLVTKYPQYFGLQTFINEEGTTINYPNVYWAGTVVYRPIDATECFLDITKAESLVFGIDGKFYKGTDDKYYIEEEEPILITVNIAVTSMKNTKLNLNDFKAQNLVSEVSAYIRNRLKSGSALEYFGYDNTIYTPIQVLSSVGDMTEVEDVSYFEETQNRFTGQFSCKFRYSEKGSREAKVATNVNVNLTELTSNTVIDFNVDE